MESSDLDFRKIKKRRFSVVAALIAVTLMSLLLRGVYYWQVERDSPLSTGWNFRVDLTVDVVQTLGFGLCALAATRKPLVGVLTAGGLLSATLLLQLFVVQQSLGAGVWLSLVQGMAIGYGIVAASKAHRLHASISASEADRPPT